MRTKNKRVAETHRKPDVIPVVETERWWAGHFWKPTGLIISEEIAVRKPDRKKNEGAPGNGRRVEKLIVDGEPRKGIRI